MHLGLVMKLPLWRDSLVIVQLVQCLRRQRLIVMQWSGLVEGCLEDIVLSFH